MKTLETPRLILRKWRKNDVSDLFEIMRNSSLRFDTRNSPTKLGMVSIVIDAKKEGKIAFASK